MANSALPKGFMKEIVDAAVREWIDHPPKWDTPEWRKQWEAVFSLPTAPSAAPIPTSPYKCTDTDSARGVALTPSRAAAIETRYQHRFYWVDETRFRVWPEPKLGEPVEFHTYDTVTGEWTHGPAKAIPLDATGHDFGPGFGLDRCTRCGTTVEQIEDNHGPLMCPQAERQAPKFLPETELDGSIAKRMREIAQNEGRTVPDWPNDENQRKTD